MIGDGNRPKSNALLLFSLSLFLSFSLFFSLLLSSSLFFSLLLSSSLFFSLLLSFSSSTTVPESHDSFIGTMEKVVVNLNASKVLPHQHEEWKESAWNNNAWHSLVVEETEEVEKVEKVEKEHHSNNGKKTIAIENGNIQSTTDNSNTDVSEEFNIAQSILDEMKRNEASIEQDGEEEPMEFNDREIVQEQEKEKDQEQKQEIFRVVRPVSGKDPQKGENIQCSFCVPSDSLFNLCFMYILYSFCYLFSPLFVPCPNKRRFMVHFIIDS